MGEATDVGFIFQCSLCGSFAIFAVDALPPAELAMRAEALAGGVGQKVLQKDLHAAEESFLQDVQRRLRPQGEVTGEGGRHRFVLLPCAACLEIQTGRPFQQWLDDGATLDQPTPLSPQVPVTFEADEGPPAYVHKAGKWTLACGVGPKDLEVKLPNQLPAGQFRVLLPQEARPLRPPCRGEKDGEEEPPEVWECRRTLLAAMGLLTAEAGQGADRPQGGRGKAVAAERAPALGVEMPWLSDFLELARSEHSEARKGKSSRKSVATAKEDARYVPVPLMSKADVVCQAAEDRMSEVGIWYS
mmetsp:Transcript_96715/g.282734  ORF Transcript_96715/g.282734 Transcript_96715/m.282734 type:complete len:301 (+) Transcript_96715:49-951(+)